MATHEQRRPTRQSRGAALTNRSSEESASHIVGTTSHPVNGSTYGLRPSSSGFRRERVEGIVVLAAFSVAGAIACALICAAGDRLWIAAAAAVVAALILGAWDVMS